MSALAKYAFSPDAMKVPASIIPYLQTQRRGYNFFASTEDPKLHDMVENIQVMVLYHLLSDEVMLRLTDSREYGNTYGCGEMLGDLTDACFKEDLAGSVNSHRQLLQINYVNMLISIAGFQGNSSHDNISKARATSQLLDIQKKMKSAVAGDKDTKDHRTYLVQLIRTHALTKMMTLKFGSLSAEHAARIEATTEQQLDMYIERILTASTADEVFAAEV
jgi:hypothetical protein